MARLVRRCGLGLLVGAVLQQPLSGQERPPRDTTRGRDTTRVQPPVVAVPIPTPPDALPGDTARQATSDTVPPRDTIKAPLPHVPPPPSPDIGGAYRWTREELMASGALTLLELLERIPGATGLRPGWFTTAQITSYLGDVRRVRVFYDGIELDPLDPRAGGVLDPGELELWSLDEVVIERGAAELRVYCRSWSVERTTAHTRTDVMTGDEETNLYRGSYGRRFAHGEVLQLGGQQVGSTVERTGGGGDALSLLGRVGIARRLWSADAFLLRTRRHRSLQENQLGLGSLPEMEGVRSDAYVRLGAGRVDAGPWAQLIAASLAYDEVTPHVAGADTVDSLRSRAQYTLAAGWTMGPLRAQAMHRHWAFGGHRFNAPSGRVSLESRFASVSVFAEGEGPDSTSRVEAIGSLTPLPFVRVAGAIARIEDARTFITATPDTLRGGETIHARAELGLRLGRLWFSGGMLVRDSALLAPPTVLGATIPAVREASARGTFVAVRGRLFKALHADAFAVAWEERGFYRPKYQARSQIYLRSRWLSRFPSGNFGVLAAVKHDYRSAAEFPTATGTEVADQSQVVSTHLEVRIVSAVLFWQFRNLIARRYQLVPGFDMPPQANLYGVRWEFWN